MTVANERLIELAESPEARFWSVDYQELSAPERVFRAVWELESEVNNGGFVQYFHNSSGELVPFILESLHAIGATRAAAVVKQAIDVAGPRPWADDAARREYFSQLSLDIDENLGELDQAFFQYPDDLNALLYRHVQQHRADIRGVPEDF